MITTNPEYNEGCLEEAKKIAPEFCKSCLDMDFYIQDDHVLAICNYSDLECPSEKRKCMKFRMQSKGSYRPELTKKQYDIFYCIGSSFSLFGYFPHFRELANEFGVTVKCMYDHIKAIEKKGYIEYGKKKRLIGFNFRIEHKYDNNFEF